MVCGPPTTTRESIQFISLHTDKITYELHRVILLLLSNNYRLILVT